MQTKPAISAGIFRDLYVALGEPLDADHATDPGKSAWSLRIYVKPFVRWIWFGGLCMMIGGMIAAIDRRFRADNTKTKPDAASSNTATVA